MQKTIKQNLYSRVRYKYDRRVVQAEQPNDIWALDLVDMNSTELSNSGYIMNAVDIASRYAQSVKLQNKSKESIIYGLSELFKLFGHKPLKIWSDKEAGLVPLKDDFLRENHIELYHVNNSYMGAGSHSVSIVERFNRTMKEAMMEIKTQYNGNWNHIIAKTIDSFIPEYNKTVHGTIGTTPYNAYTGVVSAKRIHKEQEKRVNEKKKAPKEILPVGTRVHLQKRKTVIRGKKETKYHKEVYVISGHKDTNPITYTLYGMGKTGYYRQQFILAKRTVDANIEDADTDIESTDIESD